MSLLLASVGDLYTDGIVDTGRQPQFLFLLAFLLTFGFIRTSTHMIRAQVSWWPGNVSTKGGMHIHHMVFGIITIMVVGWFAVVNDVQSPGREICAVLFGIGTGLTLDEYALWLNLKDVYWEKQGRASIDAVIVAASLAGILFVGLRGWIDAANDVEDLTKAVVGFVGLTAIVLGLVNAAKEKFGFALISVVLPVIGLIGAARLAKPHSLWARIYGRHRRERALRRYGGEAMKPFWRRRGSLADIFSLGLGLGRRA
ncbi:MAG: hypothetical protein M3O25_10975 [Actinomycetota bacterium]|nr:hypothetical protein [Actinomycetota bacterium]